MPKKPLVLDRGLPQQLQGGTDLDIPLDERFGMLQSQFRTLVFWLAEQGFDLPDELITEIDLTVQAKGKQKC